MPIPNPPGLAAKEDTAKFPATYSIHPEDAVRTFGQIPARDFQGCLPFLFFFLSRVSAITEIEGIMRKILRKSILCLLPLSSEHLNVFFYTVMNHSDPLTANPHFQRSHLLLTAHSLPLFVSSEEKSSYLQAKALSHPPNLSPATSPISSSNRASSQASKSPAIDHSRTMIHTPRYLKRESTFNQ